MSHNNRRNKDLFQRLTESWGYTKEEEPLDEQMAAGEDEEEEEVQEEGVYQRDEDEDELEEGGAADRPESKGKGVDSPDRGKRVSEQAEAEEDEDVVEEQAEEQAEDEDVVEEQAEESDEDLEEAIRRVVQKVLNELVK